MDDINNTSKPKTNEPLSPERSAMIDLVVENAALKHALKHARRNRAIEDQEELLRHTISQIMTWFVPKFRK